MNNEEPEAKKPSFYSILWWSALPSCMIAFCWSGDFMSKLSVGQPNDTLLGVLTLIDFPIFFVVFFVLVWTPLLAATLIVCALLPVLRAFYNPRTWFVFVILLLPFPLCFHTLHTMPMMDAYRRFFHLHQLVDARLSEDQVLAIAGQVAKDHGKNLDDYKSPDVVFYPQLKGSPSPGEWQIIYYPKTQFTHEKPETHHSIFVRIIDKTGSAEYRENN